MPYSFRNREGIKAPERLDDSQGQPRRVSYKEPDVYDEKYAPHPHSTKLKHSGPIVEINPNLPPAAFPTLDYARKAPSSESSTVEFDTLSISEQDESAPYAGQGPEMAYLPEISRRDEDMLSSTCNSDCNRTSINQFPCIRKPSISGSSILIDNIQTFLSNKGASQSDNWAPMDSIRLKQALRLQKIKSSESIFEKNMTRMELAGNLNDEDKTILEMMTSDEEERKDQTSEQQGQEFIAWDDLLAAQKVELAEVVAGAYPDQELPRKLRLQAYQTEHLSQLLEKSNQRLFKEDRRILKHQRKVRQKLLRGATMTQEKYRRELEEDVYKRSSGTDDDDENDDDHHSRLRIERAKAYLRQCDLDPQLLDKALVPLPEAIAATVERSNGSDLALSMHMDGEASYDRDTCRAPTISKPSSGMPRLHTYRLARRRRQNLDGLSLKPCRPPHPHGPSQTGKTGPPVRHPASRLTIAHPQHQPRNIGYRHTQNVPSTPCAAKEHPSVDGQTLKKSKRRANPIPETAFLSNKRGPGARQPKLSEKAMEAALEKNDTTPTRKRGCHLNGSTNDKVFPFSSSPHSSKFTNGVVATKESNFSGTREHREDADQDTGETTITEYSTEEEPRSLKHGIKQGPV